MTSLWHFGGRVAWAQGGRSRGPAKCGPQQFVAPRKSELDGMMG
jgi:hypothetical protein